MEDAQNAPPSRCCTPQILKTFGTSSKKSLLCDELKTFDNITGGLSFLFCNIIIINMVYE